MILGLQALDYLLLLAIQPTGEGKNKQMPGLHQEVHQHRSRARRGSHSETLTIYRSHGTRESEVAVSIDR
ncbi:MAG: hypothetical protein CMJ46_16235 [Planctomyces sp.]|nr:hypothetical protein [Planctomyces sp.]